MAVSARSDNAIIHQRISAGYGASPRLDLFDMRDFPLEHRHVLFQLPHTLFQSALMLLQEQAPLGCGCVAVPPQLGKAHHLRAGHSGIAQANQQFDPRDIALGIAAMAARCARNWSEQPDTLVVAQGINAQASLPRNLLDGECCFHISKYETWSALQVKRRSGGDFHPHAMR